MSDVDVLETEASENKPKKRGNLMTMLIVAGLMIAEAAVVYVAVGILGGGPSGAEAAELAGSEELDRETPVEIQLVEDRFQNMDSGRVWGWQVDLYLKVRKKNQPEVEKIMEREKAGVKEGIALIIRRARDRHLREPGMETLNRQLTAWVNDLFGTDADGLPMVDRVIIAKLRGNPEDI